MPHCPQCQHPLPAPRANRRQACTLCGWVEPPPEQPLRADAKAQEIARQRALDATPVWKYVGLVLGGLTLLVVLSNLFSQGFVAVVKQADPSASVSPESSLAEPTAEASPAPTAAVSNVPVTLPTAELTVSPDGLASPQAAATARASGSPDPSASASPSVAPSGNALPGDTAALQQEAEAEVEAVSSALNALEAPPAPDSGSGSSAPQVQPPALGSALPSGQLSAPPRTR